jgi:hypothetical protein
MGDANLPPALQARAKANFNAALDYIYEVQVSKQGNYPNHLFTSSKWISGNILLC